MNQAQVTDDLRTLVRTHRAEEFTVKEYAYREKVSVVTVRRWIKKGAVEIRRTPGVGIRIILP
jgi:DNA-directed RNA polymerase specialized sigma24 family protein